MYLILSDADGNVTSVVFHDGVDVIGLRATGEEKGHRKDPTEKAKEDPSEKIRLRRSVGEDPSKTI